MYHIVRLFLVVTISSVLLTGCNSNTRELLQSAEQLMSSRPDSALTILQNVDTANITKQKEQALFALLYSQALDKNNINVKERTTIQTAVNYYSNHGSKCHRMLAYYYMARIEQHNKSYSDAILYLVKAENIGLKLKDHFYLGLIYRSFFEILYNVRNSVESLHYATLQHEEFKKTGKEAYINWALKDIAVAHCGTQDYYTALKICQEVIDTELSKKHPDKYLLEDTYKMQAICYFATKEYRKTIELYNKITRNNAKAMDVVSYRNLGLAYIRSGQTDSALYYMDIVSKLDSTDLWLNYEIHNYLGNTEEALAALKIEERRSNNIIEEVLTQNASATLVKQKELENISQDKEQKYKTLGFIFITATIIVVFTLIYITNKQRLKAQEQETEKYMLTVSNLLNKLENKNIENYNLQEANIRLFKERFNELDSLCNRYYELSERETEEAKKEKIYRSVKRQISNLTTDSKTIKELENNVNYFKNNLMIKFREEVTNLSEEDCTLFLLLVSGFSTRAISILINKEVRIVYKRKSRLKENINKISTPNKQLFLKHII